MTDEQAKDIMKMGTLTALLIGWLKGKGLWEEVRKELDLEALMK